MAWRPGRPAKWLLFWEDGQGPVLGGGGEISKWETDFRVISKVKSTKGWIDQIFDQHIFVF